ncbi:hypothetical protein INT47_003759 [Mucor saturninus]|uniref:Uncharacterized protein n=1 Tax=Mucor saturninus TaxID=64648 RepID=A0A8H7R8Z2_9FUNG|nr:hypothetical protein INT47_003759 [Mucor saturninus]
MSKQHQETDHGRSIFDDPVDLFNFNQIQSSRSVPASRRNSHEDHNNLDLLLGTTLSLNNTDSESGFRKSPFTITPQDQVTSFKSSMDDVSEISSLNPRLSQANESPKRYPTHAELAKFTSAQHTPWLTNYHWEFPTSMGVCPQLQQVGFCPRQDLCPYAHPTGAFFVSNNNSSLYQQDQQRQPFFTTPVIKKKQQQQQQQQDRFAEASVEDFTGKLFDLCKDQNGCRFLQKKIEENQAYLDLVFDEIQPQFVQLMTDPFGNYLCQKMLEKCHQEQRTLIVETVAPDLVNIALNMHGTRAVQKLIEYLSTPQQISMVTDALNANVVTLIKDLNGNHVIQKCLHRLSADDNQFIYDAVCTHCIQVASHKHGCCVLQRCFDHATLSQKDQLVEEIAKHALTLVQNAFGNYVVQYVLELGVAGYSESIIRRFVNHVCILSVQKFSSNVIENCIRTAQPATRRLLIAELVNPSVMEKLLHNSFANYVVQTSLDFAEEDQRAELVECIRPLLPTIRTTPYGKRIHSKIFRDPKPLSKN